MVRVWREAVERVVLNTRLGPCCLLRVSMWKFSRADRPHAWTDVGWVWARCELWRTGTSTLTCACLCGATTHAREDKVSGQHAPPSQLVWQILFHTIWTQQFDLVLFSDSFHMALPKFAFTLFHVVTFYLTLGDNVPTALLDIDPKRIHLLSWLFWNCFSVIIPFVDSFLANDLGWEVTICLWRPSYLLVSIFSVWWVYKSQLPIHAEEEKLKASSGVHCSICIQELHNCSSKQKYIY